MLKTAPTNSLSEGGPQQMPIFSPDGNVIAFARDNNLFVVKLLFGNAETQVTKDGKFNEVLNGIPDWVNEEEFATNRSFDFSADSRMLAWVRYDESKVPVYAIREFKGSYPTRSEYDEYPGEYRYKYPVAGAKNSDVSVHTYDIKDRVTRTPKVPLDADGYVPPHSLHVRPQQIGCRYAESSPKPNGHLHGQPAFNGVQTGCTRNEPQICNRSGLCQPQVLRRPLCLHL